MPIHDIFKRVIPKVGASDADSDGPPNIQKAFEDFSASLHAPVAAGSLSEAGQIATSSDAGAFPLIVYRTDIGTLEVKKTQGAAWAHLGGPQHACEANVARTVAPFTVTDLHVDSFDRMSEGWAVSGGKIVIPATGLYLVQCLGTIEGVMSGNDARRFLQYTANGGVKQRWPMTGETISGGMDMRYFSAGTVIAVQGYHAMVGSQIVRAEIQIVQIAKPRWVNV